MPFTSGTVEVNNLHRAPGVAEQAERHRPGRAEAEAAGHRGDVVDRGAGDAAGRRLRGDRGDAVEDQGPSAGRPRLGAGALPVAGAQVHTGIPAQGEGVDVHADPWAGDPDDAACTPTAGALTAVAAVAAIGMELTDGRAPEVDAPRRDGDRPAGAGAPGCLHAGIRVMDGACGSHLVERARPHRQVGAVLTVGADLPVADELLVGHQHDRAAAQASRAAPGAWGTLVEDREACRQCRQAPVVTRPALAGGPGAARFPVRAARIPRGRRVERRPRARGFVGSERLRLPGTGVDRAVVHDAVGGDPQLVHVARRGAVRPRRGRHRGRDRVGHPQRAAGLDGQRPEGVGATQADRDAGEDRVVGPGGGQRRRRRCDPHRSCGQSQHRARHDGA